jgi:hypothetical protein
VGVPEGSLHGRGLAAENSSGGRSGNSSSGSGRSRTNGNGNPAFGIEAGPSLAEQTGGLPVQQDHQTKHDRHSLSFSERGGHTASASHDGSVHERDIELGIMSPGVQDASTGSTSTGRGTSCTGGLAVTGALAAPISQSMSATQEAGAAAGASTSGSAPVALSTTPPASGQQGVGTSTGGGAVLPFNSGTPHGSTSRTPPVLAHPVPEHLLVVDGVPLATALRTYALMDLASAAGQRGLQSEASSSGGSSVEAIRGRLLRRGGSSGGSIPFLGNAGRPPTSVIINWQVWVWWDWDNADAWGVETLRDSSGDVTSDSSTG